MMKNIFRFVLILGLFIFATSAYAEIYEEDGYIGPLEYHNEYRYHKVKKIALCTYIFQKYGKYGIIVETHNKDNTVNAKIKIPPIYDKIEVLGLGYIGVSLDGKWGVRESINDYPGYNKIVVPIEWDYVEKFGDVSNEIFIVKRNDKFGLVNSKNEMLLDVELDSIFQLSPSKTFAYTKNGNEKYDQIFVKHYDGIHHASFECD